MSMIFAPKSIGGAGLRAGAAARADPAKKNRGQSVIMCMDPMCNRCPPEMHAHMHGMNGGLNPPLSKAGPAKRRFTLKDLDEFDSDEEDQDYEEESKSMVITIRFCGLRLTIKRPAGIPLLPPVLNPHNKYVKRWTRTLLYVLFFAFLLDPLFLYVLSFSYEWYCVYNKYTMLYVLVAIRCAVDLFTLLNMILWSRLAFKATAQHVRWNWIRNSRGDLVKTGELVIDDEKAIFYNYCANLLVLDLLCLIPYPQIIYLGVLPLYSTIDVAYTWNVILRLSTLVQTAPRFVRILRVISGTSGHQLFESAWSTFMLNLFAFFTISYITGAVWFLLTEQRVAWCLQELCSQDKSFPVCKPSYLSCPYDTGPTAGTNREAWINTMSGIKCYNNSGPVPMGIYENGVQAVYLGDVFNQWLYSFMWGFQQISTFGGNLVATTIYGEVFFMLFLVACGLFLFALLIGNMQNFLQGLSRRTAEHQLQVRDVSKWMEQREIPRDIQKRIQNLDRYVWTVNQGVDEEAILSTLTEDIQRDVRRHLFLQPLKKCLLLGCMSSQVQDAICERLKSRQYIDGTEVIRENVPVSRMFFVLRGALESISTAKGRTGFFERQILTKGDFFGEELLVYFIEKYAGESAKGKRRSLRRDVKFNSAVLKDALPRSERTVKCLGPVDGFSLEAEDIDYVCTQFYRDMQGDNVQRALNICSKTRQSRAATTIQCWWRSVLRRMHDIPFDVFVQAVRMRRLGMLVRQASDILDDSDGFPPLRSLRKKKSKQKEDIDLEKGSDSDEEMLPKARSKKKVGFFSGSGEFGKAPFDPKSPRSGSGKGGMFGRVMKKGLSGSEGKASFGKILSIRSKSKDSSMDDEDDGSDLDDLV